MNQTEQTARRVLAGHYRLHDAQLHLLHSTGGALKHVFQVAAGGATYVLKRYRPGYRPLQAVTNMHLAQVYLKKNGIPTPAVIPDTEGRLALEFAGSCWVLYEWVPGRHYRQGELTARTAAALGEMVGLVARRLQPWPVPTWEGVEPFQAYPAEAQIAHYERLLRHAERGSRPVDEQCRQVLRHKIGALERMSGWASRILGLPRQWVHGDVNDGNLFWAGDRITALIDFDNIRQAPRGFDFMYGLSACFLLDTPYRDDYARAYIDVVRPSPAELEVYAPLWAYWEMSDIWPIDVLYLEPEAYDPAWRIDSPDSQRERRVPELTEWLLRV